MTDDTTTTTAADDRDRAETKSQSQPAAVDDIWDDVDLPRGVELPDEGTEAETERDGLLSYAGEWHAVLLGMLAGVTYSPVVIGVFVAYVLGQCRLVSVVSEIRGDCPLNEAGHLKQAAREQAYSAAGVLLGLGLNLLVIGDSLFGSAVAVAVGLPGGGF